MKNLRQICATLALALAFTLPVSADGIIHTDKTGTAADGIIHTDKTGTTTDTATEIALRLLQSVIALF
jgi:hypothetical protein